MKRNRWILWAIVAGLVAVGAGGAYWASRAAIPVSAAVVQTGTIREYIDERGKTRLAHVHEVTMPFNGRLQRIELREGDAVQAGQMVAQIVPEDVEHEVAEAQAAVDRLQAAIAENADHAVEDVAREQAQEFIASMTLTVEAAEARKRAGQQRLVFAQSFLDRMKALHERGANTLEELEEAQVNLVEREVDVQQDELVTQSLQSILAATRLLPEMIDEYISHKSLTGLVLEKQRAEAEARLRQVLTRQHRGAMLSPVDGVVLTKRLDDEQFVPAGAVLMEIGDLSHLEVEVDVLSQDATRVREPADVQIYGVSIGHDRELEIQGRVRRIYPQAFTKISSLGVEQQRVRVIVELEPAAVAELRQLGAGVDYRVRTRICTAERDAVAVAPRAAVFRSSSGSWQVFAVHQGQAHLRDVELGLMNDEQVEVLSGLQAQDTVIVAPDNLVEDGIRVEVKK